MDVAQLELRSGLGKGDIQMSITSVGRSSAPVKTLDVMFMLANAVGGAIYLLLASRGWRIPEEHGGDSCDGRTLHVG